MLLPKVTDRRVLHMGNIAHNAFWNAQTLLRHDIESDVLVADYYHFGGSPLWLILGQKGVSRAELGNDHFPNFFRFEETVDGLPSFFAQGPQFAAITHLVLKRTGHAEAAEESWHGLAYWRFKAMVLQNAAVWCERWTKSHFERMLNEFDVAEGHKPSLRRGRMAETYQERLRTFYGILHGEEVARNTSLPHSPAVTHTAFGVYAQKNGLEGMHELQPSNDEQRFVASLWKDVENYRERGLTIAYGHELLEQPFQGQLAHFDGLLAEDFSWVHSVYSYWKALFACYRYRFCYANTGMFALLTESKPYAAYEHGTIRGLPFENTQAGRLTLATFMNASCTLITNADYVIASPRLEFPPERIAYCPHGFDSAQADGFLTKQRTVHSKQTEGKIVRFIAPARHDWKTSHPDNSKGNDLIVKALALLKARGIIDLRVTFVSYGADIAASQALIEELDVADLCAWIEPQPLHALWDLYCSHHAVIDQFIIPAIGAIGVECLALGRRLITRDIGALAEFFQEQPPLIAASSPEEIADGMARIVADPDDHEGIGPAARKWFLRRHGDEAVVAALKTAMKRIDADYAAYSPEINSV
jgi:glycosyltransferase involved in cell wall biosynthesis